MLKAAGFKTLKVFSFQDAGFKWQLEPLHRDSAARRGDCAEGGVVGDQHDPLHDPGVHGRGVDPRQRQHHRPEEVLQVDLDREAHTHL